MITETEKKVIAVLSDDLPIVPEPFKLLADKVGITEDEFIKIAASLKARGIIRRFGLVLRHREAGYAANALSVWRVDKEDLARVVKILTAEQRVTHCYTRRTCEAWQYNLYAMIHGASEEVCESIAKRLSDESGIEDYRLLWSIKEWKKEALKYYQ